MVRKKWYSGRGKWGNREMNFFLSVEYNFCSAICSLRNRVELCPPFYQEAEGSTMVTILAMWSCGSENSMLSLIFTLCHVSVYAFSQPWRTPILCVYLEVSWLSCHMTSCLLTSLLRWFTGKSNPDLISQCLFSTYFYPDLFLLSQEKHTPPKEAQH